MSQTFDLKEAERQKELGLEKATLNRADVLIIAKNAARLLALDRRTEITIDSGFQSRMVYSRVEASIT
jgi:hypothetical protein